MRNTPKMTRGHFEAIAWGLKELQPTEAWDDSEEATAALNAAHSQWLRTVGAMADLCHDASNMTPNGNRAFDRDRFLRACGLEG